MMTCLISGGRSVDLSEKDRFFSSHFFFFLLFFFLSTHWLTFFSVLNSRAAQRLEKPAPSGIAQLRQSVDQRTPRASSVDPMNLDEFIIPSSIGSPAGIEPSQLDLAVPSAIPIKGRKEHIQSHNNLAPASLPYTSQDLHRSDEFGYVQRRVRKTSVDERKVGLSLRFLPSSQSHQLISR
jgi:hypothetical protein